MYREQVMDLWKLCFHDTDEFTRFYFDHKYKSENTLVYSEQGEVVAALQMLPYPMTFYGATVYCSYISGACTNPAVRSKGIMKSLLHSALGRMKDRHIPLSILIPQEQWLFDYYKRAGYTAAFYGLWQKNRVIPGNNVTNVVRLKREDAIRSISEYYSYFTNRMQQYDCCVQHTEEDFNSILLDLYASGGGLLVAHDTEGAISGMAFAIPQESQLLFTELLYESEDDRQQLMEKAACYWKRERVEYKLFANTPDSTPFGMLRIVDALDVLDKVAQAQPTWQVVLRVTDEILPDNTAFYQIRGGKCCKTSIFEGPVNCSLNIEELAQMLIGNKPLPENCDSFIPRVARVSLMLE